MRLIALIGVICFGWVFAQDNGKDPVHEASPVEAGYVVTLDQGLFDNRMGSIQSRGPSGVLWQHVIQIPEATFIKVYFENYHLAPRDELLIMDQKGHVYQTIYGSGPGGQTDFWSLMVPGDTMILQIDSANDYSRRSAFQVFKAFYGTLDIFGLPEPIESVCSSIPLNDRYKSAFCYSPGQPNEDPGIWSNAQGTVGVLTIGNYNTGSWCSGSLVSSQDYILTNQHCIETATQCGNAEFVFNYYRATCDTSIGGIDPITTQGYYCDPTDGTTYFNNPFIGCTPSGLTDLDYAFCKVLLNGPDPSPSSVYPVMQMELDHSVIENTVDMYISGHPEGNARVISEGVLDFTTAFGLHYICDTRGGSSGSPVFSKATNRLIGLHHCGGCDTPSDRNRGMFIDQIRADIDTHGNYFDPVASLSFQSIAFSDMNMGDDDGFFDIGETIEVTVDIASVGQLATDPGTMTMSSAHPGIQIDVPTQPIPGLDPGAEGATSATLNFSFMITGAMVCGDSFTIDFEASYGANLTSAASNLQTGEVVDLGTTTEQSSAHAPIAIPDNNPGSPAVSVQTFATSGDVVVGVQEVEVNITHTYIGDLIVRLESPTGTQVNLHDRTGGTTDNLNVTYGDGTGGTILPAGNLDDFLGEPIDGDWSLIVSDHAGVDTGTLDSWRLLIGRGSLDCSYSENVCIFEPFSNWANPAAPPALNLNGMGGIDVIDILMYWDLCPAP